MELGRTGTILEVMVLQTLADIVYGSNMMEKAGIGRAPPDHHARDLPGRMSLKDNRFPRSKRRTFKPTPRTLLIPP